MSHRYVSANVRAFVDEHIKELVELLNTFDNICTYMSCEGGDGKYASIFLRYGTGGDFLANTWEAYLALATFAKRLADAITPVLEESGGLKSPLFYLDMSIKWRGNGEFPIFIMEMPPCRLAEITQLFYKVKKEFDHSVKGKTDIDLSELIADLS